jgi:hypothetical protein
MTFLASLSLLLVQLLDADRNVFELNAMEIVKLHDITDSETHAPGTKCLISTSDGKAVAVIESCTGVHRLIIEALKSEVP